MGKESAVTAAEPVRAAGAQPAEAAGPATSGLLVPVFGIVYLATLAALVLKAVQPLGDPDTWWHLVMGHKFLEGTSVRHPGPMSHFGTRDWHSRDWVAQIVAAKFDDWFGLAGVAALVGLVMIALVVALLWAARANAAFVAASLATALGVLASGATLTPRPQVASFVLMAITVGASLRTAQDRKARWWLIPLSALWACVHGFWFVGIVVEVAVLLGLLLDRAVDRRTTIRLALVPFGSVLAVGLTPNGLYQLMHPTGESMGVAWAIVEYQPPTLDLVNFDIFLVMLGAVVLSWARGRSPSWVELGLVGLALLLALNLQRTIPLGAIILVPFFAGAVQQLLGPAVGAVTRQRERLTVGAGAFAAAVAVVAIVPFTATEPSDGEWPTRFEPFLAELPAEAIVFNELGDGGYLAWRLPGLRIVGDGLSDQYDPEWLNSYFSAVLGSKDSYAFVQRTGATYALLYREDALTEVLPLHGWRELDADDDRVLLAAPGASG